MFKWHRVEGGSTYCQECGAKVEVSWRLYVTPTTSTLCYCERCVEHKLQETA
jgi:RNA polymerase-binding transcription factor DksA